MIDLINDPGEIVCVHTPESRPVVESILELINSHTQMHGRVFTTVQDAIVLGNQINIVEDETVVIRYLESFLETYVDQLAFIVCLLIALFNDEYSEVIQTSL